MQRPVPAKLEDTYGSSRADLAKPGTALERESFGRLVTNLIAQRQGGLIMVASNRIRCTVVAVPVSSEEGLSRGDIARDILPWADPYVAQLIKNLQDEVRSERRMKTLARRYSLLGGDGAAASASGRISAAR